MSANGTDSNAWTVARLLEWTREHLAAKGLDSPRLCAEILLANAMGCARIHLYTRFTEVPDEKALGTFRGLVREAAQGVPIAYLTGSKEFFSLAFEVTPDVLIPRPETEILVERVLSVVRGAYEGGADVLDLGTGSGCIAVSLARHLPAARLFASDVAEAVLPVARRNAERHGVAERVEFRLGDLFAPWTDNTPTRFDLIVCNPPYIATEGAPVDESVRRYEPAGALFAGPDGLDMIRRVLAEAPRHLRPGGHLLLEMAFDQAPAARELAGAAAWQEAATYRDGAGYERVLHVRRAPDGAAQVA